MGRMAWWGTTASLAICLVWGSVSAEDNDTYQSANKSATAKKKNQDDPGSGWSWWPFQSDDDKIAADKKAAEKAKSTDGKVPKPAPNPLVTAEPVNEAATVLAKERANFLRRQQVCDKLREIAHETNDDELERQAELLEQRAWCIYEQRTAKAKMSILLPPMGDKEAKSKLVDDTAVTAKKMGDRPTRSVKASGPGVKTDEGE